MPRRPEKRQSSSASASRSTDIGDEATNTNGLISTEEEFEVEKIVAVREIKHIVCRTLQNEKEYLIKWKGWDNIWNQWINVKNLSCDELLAAFEKKRKNQTAEDVQKGGKAGKTPTSHKKRRSVAKQSHVKKSKLANHGDSKTLNWIRRNEHSSDDDDHNFDDDLEKLLTNYKTKWYLDESQSSEDIKILMRKNISNDDENEDDQEVLSVFALSTDSSTNDDESSNNRRRQFLAKLKESQRKIDEVCHKNNLKSIKLENNVDYELFPENFSFIVENIYDKSINFDKEALIGCKCALRCSLKDNCCPIEMGSELAYKRNGQIMRPEFERKPIYECNSKCSCDSTCPNRLVQKNRQFELCIFRTKNGRGWGVKTLEPIRKGSFVLEYVGQVITSAEADNLYTDATAEYLFDLDFHDWNAEYVIDATNFGNESHFVNHSVSKIKNRAILTTLQENARVIPVNVFNVSCIPLMCQPNLSVYVVFVEHLDVRLPRIALFAIKDIPAGKELTFDYTMMSQVGNRD
uniref:Histone-lysine N-methyltransferase n=1 Tax=Romanomermis culicivorax TaxID=13658 RepID=A0A915J472_ROMCU